MRPRSPSLHWVSPPLLPPGAAYKEVFRGRFTEDERRVVFIEEGTWIRVAVDRDALCNSEYKGARGKELKEKLKELADEIDQRNIDEPHKAFNAFNPRQLEWSVSV